MIQAPPESRPTQTYTPYQSQYLAHLLTLSGSIEEKLSRSLSSAKVDMNPHQVDAALFALRSPLSRGAVLADEVGLGKTIEASLVMAQRWAEGKKHILLIVPASLRKQWSQELAEKFYLDSMIFDGAIYRAQKKAGNARPLDCQGRVVICSYEFAVQKSSDIAGIQWDLVIFDEAHKLKNPESKRYKALDKALPNCQKLLLTATPLQNKLIELHSLVSLIDPHFFGSDLAFRAQYGARPTTDALLLLRDRLKNICQRTLRREAMEAGDIKFTKRYPLTEEFTPSDDEQALYDQVSGYLQQDNIQSIGANGKHLVILVIRKILGSSSFAIRDTLKRMIERLEKDLKVTDETVDDYDAIGDLKEEMDILDAGASEEVIEPNTALKAEINELKRLYAIADGIRDNQKGLALIRALGKALPSVLEKGGLRKAVIFTESVRTQTYLKDLLSANGYDGQIVLMNGSNNDPESQAIYRAWRDKHKDAGSMSGSKTADTKAAIVEKFRTDGVILIATESGGEGINLQFCSLLINYDLPWNPQRVEQRIGRCHRYGQKIDVAVLNFINMGNRAERRVYQLLNEKFHLFDGVFGASDEVLGAIESGVDIEQRILAVYQQCRSVQQVDEDFDKLQDDLKETIEQRHDLARQAILQNMDENVVQRLKVKGQDTAQAKTKFEERLLLFTRMALPEATFLPDNGGRRFIYKGETYTTEWPKADEQGWNFYRLAEGTLAEDLTTREKAPLLPPAAITFAYSDYQGEGQLANIIPLKGQSGYLAVKKLEVKTAVSTEERLVLCGLTDNGNGLIEEQCERLLRLPARQTGTINDIPLNDRLETMAQATLAEFVDKAQQQNQQFLDEEYEKLGRWADESEEAFNASIKQLRKDADEQDRLSRNPALAMAEKVELKRKASHLRGEATKRKKEYFQEMEDIHTERVRLLDEIETQLTIKPKQIDLFTIRWTLE
jgi:superfamily II DNA or RNA helicase